MTLPKSLVLPWPGVERTMLLDLGLALIYRRRANVKLGACRRGRVRNPENVKVIKSRLSENSLRHQLIPAPINLDP
jgi:hypothetical protein